MAETPLKRVPANLALGGFFGWLPDWLAWPLAVAAVVLLGGMLRFHGLDWDQPAGSAAPLHMHPDERFISIVAEKIDWPSSAGEYFDTAKSPLNPYNAPETPSFVYGTWPIFLGKAVATAAGSDVAVVGPLAGRLCEKDDYDTTVNCGRKMSAAFDTATILLIFLIGGALFSRRAGLAAALLYALSVIPIQLSHFWLVDPYAVFFGTATLLVSVLLVRTSLRSTSGGDSTAATRGRREVALEGLLVVALGLCFGMTVASRVNGLLLLPVPVMAFGLRVALRDWPRLGLRWRGERRQVVGHWTTDLALLCLALLIAMVVFRVAQPYAFAGPHWWNTTINQQWLQDIRRERDFQDGKVDFPPFVQFAGRARFLWPFQNLVLWGTGPALGLFAFAAAGVAVVLAFKRRELALAMPLLIVAVVFGYQGQRFVAYMRYFAPIYPSLCLLAAWGATALLGAARGRVAAANVAGAGAEPAGDSRATKFFRASWRAATRPRRTQAAAYALVGLVFAATAWWALAFSTIFDAAHPRVAASEWLYKNAPNGAVVTGEIWDDTIPYALPGRDAGKYPTANTYPYDTDSIEKVNTLIFGRSGQDATVGLNGAQYVTITSNRVRDSVKRLEREYPATIRYYGLLDSGELGFDLVAHFTLRPSFLGLSIDDSSAEESFTVYDHPEVRIYKKSDRWDPVKAVALLNQAHPERATNLLPKQGQANGLQFTAAQAETQQSGGTFTEAFDSDGLTSHLPWVWWLLWIEVAAFATVPWVTWLFRALPDRGFGLSKLFGFAGTGLLAWVTVAWGAAQFGSGLAWGAFGVVTLSGYIAGYFRRREIVTDLRERWPSWLAAEIVFLIAFFAVLALRYNNPDLWYHPQGGEKPVELAYLTAVARSSILPPYDPWFAGGTMNYYYMGWFLLAVPMRALRILPQVGFNLGLATYAGLAASVAFSGAHNLVALSKRSKEASPQVRRGWTRPSILGGLGGAVLLVGIGNLDAGHQAIERLQALNTWDLWADIPVLGGAAGLAGGLYQWFFQGATMTPFDWWRPSRVHFGQFDITEFPFWSFLFGDLHAHLMGLPFFGLAVAGVIAYIVSATARLRRHTFALALFLGVALGLVRTVHTWDFYTAALLVSAGIVAGQVLREGRWQERWWDAVAHLAMAAVVLTVVFAPYTGRFEVFESGLVRARETTYAPHYFGHFGLFVTILVAFLAVRYHEELRVRGGNPGRNPVLAMVAGPVELAALGVFLIGLIAFSWHTPGYSAAPIAAGDLSRHDNGLTTIALSCVLLVFLFNLLWIEYRSPARDIPRILGTALFAAAVGIAGGIDVVQAEYDIVRMNTAFKFLLQAWQLYALASAFAAWYIARALWQADGWRIATRPRRRPAALSFSVVLAVLLAGSAMYLWSGTRTRQEARFEGAPSGTLDGLAYLDSPFAQFGEDRGTETPADDRVLTLGDDLPLIEWLRNNVKGSPVIVEAVGPLYHWTGRISWNTGLPTVIGWDWHEVAYRTAYTSLVEARRADTARFYTDANPEFAASYLRKYNVSYVVVGTEEQTFGTAFGLAKFDQMPQLTAVFRNGGSVIYRVDRAGG